MMFLKHAEEFKYQCSGRFVPPSKFDKVRFQTAAVTLRKSSRSNECHGGKALVSVSSVPSSLTLLLISFKYKHNPSGKTGLT